MKNKEKPPRADKSALPRKIACGDICGGPEGALCQMLCEFEIRSLNKTVAKNRDISCRRRHPKPSYSDEMRESPAAQDSRCITPQNRLRRYLWGPRRGSLSNVVRVQNQIAEKDDCKKPRYSDEGREKRLDTGARCTWSYISGRVKALDKAIRRIARFFRSRGHQAVSASSPPL